MLPFERAQAEWDGIVERCYTVQKNGIALRVKVQPGAGVNRVVGIRGGELLIKVKGPPERGKANRDLVGLLAKTLGVPRAGVEIASGQTSRHKRLLLPLESEAALRGLTGP